MTETTVQTSCQLCQISDGSALVESEVVYQDDLWLARSISSTPAVAGWLLMQARRHVAEPADWNEAEAASFGPTLQRLERIVREVTGAVRIYTASLNEGIQHFHCHILPRLAEMPNGAKGFPAFGLSDLARKGEVRANPDDVTRVLAAIREKARLAAPAA
jgi:diadenosine tetraphosphate (Ap4A) HIT family hydrolase